MDQNETRKGSTNASLQLCTDSGIIPELFSIIPKLFLLIACALAVRALLTVSTGSAYQS